MRKRNAGALRLRYQNIVVSISPVRAVILGLLGSLIVVMPSVAAPTSTAAARVAPAFEASEKAHDGGTIAGVIVTIDYVRGIMNLREARKTVDVYVLPSTNIQGKANGYYSIADLKKGGNVEVLTSLVGARTNAEIIRLR